jgi:hypothetical protein
VLNEVDQPIRPMGLDKHHRLKNQAKKPSMLPKLVTALVKPETEEDE